MRRASIGTCVGAAFIDEKNIIMSFFDTLGLADPVLRALKSGGYSDPTPIQMQAIPPLMEGHDLCGIAQTGTGKTAAFALPTLSYLANNPKMRKPASCRMLVLAPTRELAAQIAEKMRGYSRHLALSIECVFGGMPIGKQARKLGIGVDILVATPGRLLDLIDNRALTLRNVEVFILDEADQMLDLGFIHALKRIATMLPKERQSLFFSATMPKSIADLGAQFLSNPVQVAVTPQATTAERVAQQVIFVDQREKPALLSLLLKSEEIDRALIFMRTKHGADRVVRQLAASGIRSAAIHGNKSQAQRTAALQGFRHGHVPILIATDIAARGIDVSGVSHVFNYEMPNVAEQYVHRIGRTARAGADGMAISFVAGDEKAYLRDIERLTRVKLELRKLPENFREAVLSLPKAAPAPAEREDRFGRGGPRGGSDRGASDRGPRAANGARGRPDRGPQHSGSRSFAQGRDGRTRDGSAAFEERQNFAGARRNDRDTGERSAPAPRSFAPRSDAPYGQRADQRADHRSSRPRSQEFAADTRSDKPQRSERPQWDNRGSHDNREGMNHRDRPQRSHTPRSDAPRSHSGRPNGDRAYGEKRERSFGDRNRPERPQGARPQGAQSYGDRPQGERPAFAGRKPAPGGKPAGNRPFGGARNGRPDNADIGKHKHAVKPV